MTNVLTYLDHDIYVHRVFIYLIITRVVLMSVYHLIYMLLVATLIVFRCNSGLGIRRSRHNEIETECRDDSSEYSTASVHIQDCPVDVGWTLDLG